MSEGYFVVVDDKIIIVDAEDFDEWAREDSAHEQGLLRNSLNKWVSRVEIPPIVRKSFKEKGIDVSPSSEEEDHLFGLTD